MIIFTVVGKTVTLRDLSSIQSKLKKDGYSGNNIENVVTKLREDPLVTVEIFTDEEYNLMGIFYPSYEEDLYCISRDTVC